MRRNLLVLALGITFLVVMTFLATIIDVIVPRHPSPPVQTRQAGPYQVTLQVDPNPPLLTQPAMLSLRIVRRDSQQPVTNAQVTFETSTQTMDMGTTSTQAQVQANGLYQAQVQFDMGGPWQVRALLTTPGAQPESATFEITAQ